MISVKVGTPPQDIDLIVDTGSSDTWMIASSAPTCTGIGLADSDKTDCNTPYNPDAPSSINMNVTTYELNMRYVDETLANGSYITDNILLVDDVVKSLQMGLAYKTDIQSGILGIGYSANVGTDRYYPGIMYQMLSQNLISTKAYSLYLDSYTSPTGSILFGAIDTSKFTGELVKLDTVPGLNEDGSLNHQPLDVELAGVGVTDQGNTTNLRNSRETMTLDSGSSLISLPPALASAVYTYFDAYDDTNSSGIIFIPCPLNSSSSPTINFLISSYSSSTVTITIKVPLSELVFPLAQMGYVPDPDQAPVDLPFSGEACALGIESTNDGYYLFGDTFLRSAYVVHDLQNNQVGLAQANINSGGADSDSSDGDGNEYIVELKAGEGIPVLTGAILSSTSVTPSPTHGGSKSSGTPTIAAKATPTGKSSGHSQIRETFAYGSNSSIGKRHENAERYPTENIIMNSLQTPKVALITGTNGISGSALLRQLSKNPVWTRIIALSRSPPSNLPSDPRVEFHSLDLTATAGEIAEALSAKEFTNVTHFFHYAYIHTDYDHPNHLEEMTKNNVPLFTNTLTAIDLTSRDSLQRVILQTGGKNYGLLTFPPASEPLTEDAHRVTDPRSLPNFYYHQEDFLWSLSVKRSWSWNITMPFWISGYVGKSGNSWVTSAAIYFSLCQALNKPAIFPGGEDEYYGKWNKGQHFSTSWVIAEFTEWLALNEEPTVKNQKFNIVDDTVTTFRDVWEGIGRYFGVETKVERKYDLMSEVKEMEKEWPKIAKQYGVRDNALRIVTWDAFVHAMDMGEWGSVVNMNKASKAGWTKKVDTIKEMEKIFGEMKNDGWIPNV
ncbi:hypothetical protein BPAE_0014g00500 [Botrytis paeoniae]|uniref:Peptidase A1 domain-containing protein n=1 Tax=Botrytis paeoniae TaxID=278948 RepID=A0A4Z1G353_9HELO|nr:hypothetical protein BPAE_0014g00500 [Botrytis paeoniae]